MVGGWGGQGHWEAGFVSTSVESGSGSHSTLQGMGPQDLEGRQPPRKDGGRGVGNGGPLTPRTTALPKGSIGCRPSLEPMCLHTAWDYQFA